MHTYVDRLQQQVHGGDGDQEVSVEIDALADGRDAQDEGGGALCVSVWW